MTINASQNIMIDPNEPLILPDRTALTGRIEWFLYSLCLLDYENLPTPMSRIEEFVNALITGEVPNIEPQSRVEEYFLAILTGDVENLHEPESRVEVLLNKLARGEFDLSDVEPIQSRYELLIAYLIKNGGMNDITYVLHEFLASETPYTMYNTQEKPTKSAILSGQTLANLCVGHLSLTNTDSVFTTYSDGTYTYSAQEGYDGSIAPANMLKIKTPYKLKPNNTYTIIVTQLTGGESKFGVRYWDGNNNYDLAEDVAKTGVHRHSFRTSDNDGDSYLELRLRHYTSERSISFKDIILLEGDYTNVDIPYFEGMQSVRIPVLTTTGKNLINMDNFHTYYNGIITARDVNSITFNAPNEWAGIIVDLSLKPNTEYYLSYDRVDSNTTTIIRHLNDENVPTGETDGGGNSFKVITKDNGKIRISIESKIIQNDVTLKNIQLEESSVATSYEPFKSNILTTTSKNLFDMNRPYDAITDSQATVTQSLDEITVSSAESGIYVNANFILDKDFFAGKTVTGSCLYESDEKDIGTVQISYQDANGEYHYQWIKTPRTFTFPNSFIGDVMLSISANNTGTPQSNTVTVKNIQLELGSTATSYEPYSEVVLRGIGDVRDILDGNTGESTQRIGEVVLNGNESWWFADSPDNPESTGTWTHSENTWLLGVDFTTISSNTHPVKNTISDKYPVYYNYSFSDSEYFNIVSNNNSLLFRVRKDRFSDKSITNFKSWLSQNPITIQYQLTTESVKTVDLSILDQDGATVEKLNTFKDITHVSCSVDEGSIYPYVEMEVATSNDEDLAAIGLKLEEKNKVQSKLIKVNDYQSDVIDNVMLGITEIYESI